MRDTTPDPVRRAARRRFTTVRFTTARQVAGFVAALALTAGVGWQTGRLLAPEPHGPAAESAATPVSTSAPRGS